jgi:hypothetical protein
MRGKKRTIQEQHELFEAMERYLEMGFSMKKACELSDIPYSTYRDVVAKNELVRAKTRGMQNFVNVQARQNIINAINKGSIAESKWWLERMDQMEHCTDPGIGGHSESSTSIAEVLVEDLFKGTSKSFL